MQNELPKTSRKDFELMERFISSGDQMAFAALHDRHRDALLRVAFQVARIGDEAEDLIQEVWLRAHQHVDRFRWNSSLRTWLISILLNKARDSHRIRTHEGPAGAENSAQPPRGMPDLIDIERAVGSLPEGKRSVFLMKALEGRSHHEIARQLGIDVATSKSRFHRARRSLREYLKIGRKPSQGRNVSMKEASIR